MNYLILLLVTLTFFLLAGCSGNVKSSTENNEGLIVDVSKNPSTAKLLEPVKVTALITNDGVKVTDEAHVEFELIKMDRSPLGTVVPERVGDGKYQIETIFDEAGVYQIVAHVSVGTEHQMPHHEITVSSSDSVADNAK